MGERLAKRNRNFEVVACVSDIEFIMSSVVRTLLALRTARTLCSDPTNCAVNVLNLVSNFAYLAEGIALASTDCVLEEFSQEAYCAAAITDVVATSTSLAAS